MHSVRAVVVKKHGLYLRQPVPIHLETHIYFHKLRWSKEPNDYLQYGLVRVDTDEGSLVYPEQLEIVKLLYEGQSVGEVEKKLGIDLDSIQTFLEFLVKSGYIRKIDSYVIFDGFEKIHPWLLDFDRGWFSWILWKPILILAFLFVLSGILLGAMHPDYIPRFDDFFWYDDIFVVVLVTFVLNFALGFFHELFHFIATKAVGAEGSMRFFGNRFFDFVFETFNYHLILVPRKLRYFVYLSGMLFDFIFIAAVFWFFYVSSLVGLELGVIEKLLRALTLLELLSIVWQFNVYLQTDIYNFLSDLIGFDNLYADTFKFLSQRFGRMHNGFIKKLLFRIFFAKDVLSSSNDLRSFSQKEKRILWFYSLLVSLGILFASLNFLVFTFPKDLVYCYRSISAMVLALHGGDGVGVIKYALSIGISLYSVIGVLTLMIYKFINKRSIV